MPFARGDYSEASANGIGAKRFRQGINTAIHHAAVEAEWSILIALLEGRSTVDQR